MKRSNINWNAAKWNKFMTAANECLAIIEKTEHKEYVEDISDIIMLCNKRMQRIIKTDEDWNYRKTTINTKYAMMRKEFQFINNPAVNKKLSRWWK